MNSISYFFVTENSTQFFLYILLVVFLPQFVFFLLWLFLVSWKKKQIKQRSLEYLETCIYFQNPIVNPLPT